METYFLDTSAVINGALKCYPKAYISPITLIELEKIKESTNKSDEIKYKARHAAKDIYESVLAQVANFPQRKLKHIINKYQLLDINDHYILACAELLGLQKGQVIFVTSDYAQHLFANSIPHIVPQLFQEEILQEEEYCGWHDYYPTDTQLNSLYSNPKNNILGCKVNEFAKIYKDDKLKDVLFWDGDSYTPLKYKDIKNNYINEVIKPRNLEQKMAIHILQNPNIKVKLLTSAWGSGKTLLALSYALEQVNRGNFNKLIFVRNNIIVADTKDIGYLPGDMKDKMLIWGAPLADHLGGMDMLEQLIMDGAIEIYPLSHMRGRSICDSIVICDECENMNDKLVTLLMSRIEENSELIFCGDVAQIDSNRFVKNNGIKAMLKHLSGHPLFGTVKLVKSERGAVAQLCDRILPPK